MIEKKKKKSKAIIISIIAMIILGFSIFLIFKNKNKIFPAQEVSERVGVFDSLFGTSKSKSLEIVDSLKSNKNPTQTNAQAGEDIKKGDILRLVGYDSNGNPIVIAIKNSSEIKDYSDIFGIAEFDINYGEIGTIIIPDMSEYQSFWERVEDLGSWIYDNTIGPFINPNNPNIGPINPPFIQPSEYPQLTVIASPSSINQGETTTISWTSENTTSCDIGNGFVENTIDSFVTEPLNSSRSFSISCKGEETTGVVSKSVFVYVNGDNNINQPKITVTANPSSINQGETTTISWTSENTTSCDIGNGFVENTIDSFVTEPLNSSRSFSISCKGEETTGVVSKSVFVYVKKDQNMPIIESIKAEPEEVEKGDYSVISWSSVNTNSCEISGISFECKKDGQDINCARYKNDNNQSSFECKKEGEIINCADMESLKTFKPTDSVRVGPINNNRSFSLICSNDNNTTSSSVFVRVKNDNNLNYPKITLTANPTNVKYGGSSLLEWETENITSGKIKISNQDELYNSVCKINGEITPCDNIKNLECENNPENENCNNLECSQNNENINCNNLYQIPLNGNITITNIRKNTSITATYTDNEGLNSRSSTVYIFVEPRFWCEDGEDNDRNELTDRDDPSCYEDFDISESSKYNPNLFEGRVPWIPQCRDGIDNETTLGLTADGADSEDPDCYNDEGKYDPDILLEYGGVSTRDRLPACMDGLDNDGNGDIDEDDPECHADGDPFNPDSYIERHYSESQKITGLPQCSDFLDNDKDGLIDRWDPSCHDDFNANNPLSYNKMLNNEWATAPIVDSCEILGDYPLEFTEQEKSQMKNILRKFYLLAPKLKDSEDILSAYREIEKNNELIFKTEVLIKECIDQKKSTSYEGPTYAYGNPWYEEGTRTKTTTYIDTKISDAYGTYLENEIRGTYESKIQRAINKCRKKDDETTSKCEDEYDKVKNATCSSSECETQKATIIAIYEGIVGGVSSDSEIIINVLKIITDEMQIQENGQNMYRNFEQIFNIW